MINNLMILWHTLKVRNNLLIGLIFALSLASYCAEDKQPGFFEELYEETSFGAWADLTLGYSRGRDNNEEELFGWHTYLYATTKFNERWNLFTEFEYEYENQYSEGDAENKIILERLKLQYTASDAFEFTIGKFNTPWGLWTPEHWTINVDNINAPLHEKNVYVPRKSIGVMIEGVFFPSNWLELKYALFLANGVGSEDKDQVFGDHLGMGGDLRVIFDEKYTLGTSVYHQDDSITDQKRDSGLVYVNVELPYNLTFRSEGMMQKRENPNDLIQTIYTSLKWQFHEKWYLAYRWDKGDDFREDFEGRHTIHTLTLGYFLNEHIRIRVEVAKHDIENVRQSDGLELLFRVGYIF